MRRARQAARLKPARGPTCCSGPVAAPLLPLPAAPLERHAVLGAAEGVQQAAAHKVRRRAAHQVAAVLRARQRRDLRLELGLGGAVEACGRRRISSAAQACCAPGPPARPAACAPEEHTTTAARRFAAPPAPAPSAASLASPRRLPTSSNGPGRCIDGAQTDRSAEFKLGRSHADRRDQARRSRSRMPGSRTPDREWRCRSCCARCRSAAAGARLRLAEPLLFSHAVAWYHFKGAGSLNSRCARPRRADGRRAAVIRLTPLPLPLPGRGAAAYRSAALTLPELGLVHTWSVWCPAELLPSSARCGGRLHLWGAGLYSPRSLIAGDLDARRAPGQHTRALMIASAPEVCTLLTLDTRTHRRAAPGACAHLGLVSGR
jgi:hypothetical protein